MRRQRHFKTVYNNESIKITGSHPTYTITGPGGKTLIIERFADGWYAPGDFEQHWASEDIAALGQLIEQRMKQL